MMSPEQEQEQLDALARVIKQRAEAAFEELMTRLQAGEDPRAAMEAVTSQFHGQYYDELSAAFSTVLDRAIGSADIRSLPVSDVALSERLYRHTAEVNAVTRQIIKDHVKGFTQARDLAMQIYEGYGFKDDPLKVQVNLPKYLREALQDPAISQGFAQIVGRIRADNLKTPALKAAYLQAIDALEAGAGDNRLKKLMQTAWFERNRYFANRIAQTELHRAYSNQVAQEIMADEATVWVKYQMSKTHPKVDICDRHAGLNGWGKGPGIYPKAQAPKPPAHPFCLSGDTLITASGRITSVYKRWFNGDVVVITTATGKSVTATINHPILTHHGWIGAGSINVGDDVVCRVVSESVLGDVVVDNHHYDVPTRVAEIVDAFLSSGKVTTREVPISAEHFHGDGIAGQVAVVGTNRKLWNDSDPPAGNGITHHPFMVAHPRLAGLFGKSILDLKFKIPWLASDCIMSILGKCASLFRRKPSHSDFVGIGATTNRDFLPLEVFSDDVPAYSGTFADREAGFTGGIAGANVSSNFLTDDSVCPLPPELSMLTSISDGKTCELESFADVVWADSVLAREIIEGKTGAVVLETVINIERLAWNEHVYNLETESGHYTSNGIITHNCRCTVRPAYEVEGEPGKPVKDAEQRFMNRLSDYDQRLIAGSRDRLQQFRDGRSLESIYNEGKNTIYRWGRVGDEFPSITKQDGIKIVEDNQKDTPDAVSREWINGKITVKQDGDITGLSTTELARLAGVPDGSVMVVKKKGKKGLLFEARQGLLRVIEGSAYVDQDGSYIYKTEFFVINRDLQPPPGLGVRLLATQVKALQLNGFAKMKLYAAGEYGNAVWNGYYTWPRYGYDANLDASIISKLPDSLRSASTVLDLMETKEGRSWWKVNGRPMNMTFDLSPGSRSLRVLQNYLDEKGYKI